MNLGFDDPVAGTVRAYYATKSLDQLAQRTIEGHPHPYLPTTLKIGFKTYEIHPWPVAQMVDDGSYGRCEHAGSVIRIATDGRSGHDIAETLLHEVLHAAWHVARLEDSDHEERIVSSLASTLAQVLRDNPDLLAYLADAYA